MGHLFTQIEEPEADNFPSDLVWDTWGWFVVWEVDADMMGEQFSVSVIIGEICCQFEVQSDLVS